MLISYSNYTSYKYPVYFKTCPLSLDIITKYVWSPIIWDEGIRRQKNFKQSNLCVIDIDHGLSIEKAKKFLTENNLKYIIAPTKNHSEKKNRFRLIMKYGRTIKNLEDFRYSTKKYIAGWGADPSCFDGARCYQPSRYIDSYNLNGRTLKALIEPIEEKNSNKIMENYYRTVYKLSGKIPTWISEFLDSGTLLNRGRNHTCYSVACGLLNLGFSKEDIFQKINNAPFDRTNFTHDEIKNVINSAKRRFG